MYEDENTSLRAKLAHLETSHRLLDAQITELDQPGCDRFALQRLKREKLNLKDQMTALRDALEPDIIA